MPAPKGSGAKLPAKQEHAPVPAILDARLTNLAKHAGAGMERVGIDDMVLPRIKLLQALSPEVNRRNPEYVKGAVPGLFLNVATRKLFRSLRVVPAAYIRHHIEWLPNRGGFVRDHGDNAVIMEQVVKRDDKNFDILRNGNIIMPTPTWYVVLVDGVLPHPEDPDTDGETMSLGCSPGIITMPRTMSKSSRQWMSQATDEKITHPGTGQQFPAPLFFRSWVISAGIKTDDTNEWFIPLVEPSDSVMDTADPTDPESDLKLPEQTMPTAIRFRDQVTSGAVRADASHFEDEGSNSRGQQHGGDQDRPM